MTTTTRLLIVLAVALAGALGGGCAEAPAPQPRAGGDGAGPGPAPMTPVASAPAAQPEPRAKPEPAPEPEPAPKPEPADVLERVVLIGASATAGFGAVLIDGSGAGPVATPTNLGDVLRATVDPARDTAIAQYGNLFFFNAPMRIGPQQVDQALAHDPTLVIGVDYLFWYGYGSRDRDDGPMDGAPDRLDLLEEGLGQLDRLPCPVVVGDFPDMSAAAGGMLALAQIPDPDTLVALNERLRAWAAERPHVVVLPFASLVADMRSGRAFTIGRFSWPAGSGRTLLQPDHLHPTPQGLVAIVQLVREELARRPFGSAAEQLDAEADPVLDRLRARSPTGQGP